MQLGWSLVHNGNFCSVVIGMGTDLYSLLDAVPPIHAESSHVATDKVPSK